MTKLYLAVFLLFLAAAFCYHAASGQLTCGNPVADNFCTHGGDEFSVELAAATVPPVIGPPAATCDYGGVKQVQVMYVRTDSSVDRYAESLTIIRHSAMRADLIFDSSAHKTGGHRHINYALQDNCEIDVLNITVSPDAIGFGSMISALMAQGYTSNDRKYLLMVDADVYCGISTIHADDQPGDANINNHRAEYARVDRRCWSGLIVAHELVHSLGGIHHGAPNADGNWHCNDGYDTMCFRNNRCAIGHILLLDCGEDDYYNTRPVAELVEGGNYLATHWNIANSMFLNDVERQLWLPLVTGG